MLLSAFGALSAIVVLLYYARSRSKRAAPATTAPSAHAVPCDKPRYKPRRVAQGEAEDDAQHDDGVRLPQKTKKSRRRKANFAPLECEPSEAGAATGASEPDPSSELD